MVNIDLAQNVAIPAPSLIQTYDYATRLRQSNRRVTEARRALASAEIHRVLVNIEETAGRGSTAVRIAPPPPTFRARRSRGQLHEHA